MYFCRVKKEDVIAGLVELGQVMSAFGNNEEANLTEEFSTELVENTTLIINRQKSYNGWFTKENVRQSLKSLGDLLNEVELKDWLSKHKYNVESKKVALIMAGNIPLVGFHDFVCVLCSGNHAVCKLSSDDKTLFPALLEFLIEINPEFKNRFTLSLGKIDELDAVIATGSDNSQKFFEEYFGKYPHVFRSNRTSVAIFNGNETKEELEALGMDIFTYFGLGCRNVSHLLLPTGFEVNRIFEGLFGYSDVINNNKYGNNYDYNKTVYLMNKLPLLDNNFCLLRETEELHSPLSMVHYHFYENQDELNDYLTKHDKSIQAKVGQDYIPFGKAQKPGLNDYADNVNIMEWLDGLS